MTNGDNLDCNQPTDVDLLIIKAHLFTIDQARRAFRNGFLAVRDGKIIDVGAMPDCHYYSSNTIDGSQFIVLPGIVNAHDHLAQSLFRGAMDELPPSSVREGGLFHLSRALTRDRARAASLLTLLELTRYGVTTTHDSHFTHVFKDSVDGVCEAIGESKLRAVVARAANDTPALPVVYRETIDEAITEIDRLGTTWNSETLTVIPEAVGTLRNTTEMIKALFEYAVSNDTIWHMHLAQNFGEREATLAKYGRGCAELLSDFGVLDSRLLAAHCVGLSDQEVELLGSAHARIAHCPLANIYRGSNIAQMMAMRRQGATVAIATDGAGTNNGQNIWEMMKVAIYLQKFLHQDYAIGSAELALEMATIEAARALNIEESVGSLEIGKDADLVMIDKHDPSLVPSDSLPSHLVYAMDPRAIRKVVIRGEVAWKDGEHQWLDQEKIVADVETARTEMIAELGDPSPRRSSWVLVD